MILFLFNKTHLPIDKYLAVGINGFLMTHEASGYLRHAIRSAIHGGCWLSPEILDHLIATNAKLASLPRVVDFTPKERVILQLSAQGAKETQIAHDLHISERTVRNHLESILNKLNVHSRIEAVAWAVKLGVIDMGE